MGSANMSEDIWGAGWEQSLLGGFEEEGKGQKRKVVRNGVSSNQAPSDPGAKVRQEN